MKLSIALLLLIAVIKVNSSRYEYSDLLVGHVDDIYGHVPVGTSEAGNLEGLENCEHSQHTNPDQTMQDAVTSPESDEAEPRKNHAFTTVGCHF